MFKSLIIVVAITAGLSAVAPQNAETQQPPTQPCHSPEHRQFDFWLGEWDVARPDGTPAGTNQITSILGGCALHESWRSARGPNEGESFTIFANGGWHQTWVDNGGSLLRLDGGLKGGRIVLSQEAARPDGSRRIDEVSWEKLPTGQVKQHWRTSTDSGRTWADAFVGIYTKKAASR